MPVRRSITRFLIQLVVVYGLLLAPWPGWREHYSSWVCGLARTVFSSEHGKLLVRFEPEGATTSHPLDTRITLANRELLAPNGSGPARILGLDAHGVGWVPTALFLALTISTPLPWRKRACAVAWGLIAIHIFLLLVIGVYVLNNIHTDSGLRVVQFSPLWKTITNGLEETFVTQMGPGFAVSVLIWLLVSFRRENWPFLPALEKTENDDGRRTPLAK